MFENRIHAGEKLGEQLSEYRGDEVLILAIPRGGVVVGAQVAHALRAPMDVIIPKKIGSPIDPELAIGAVTPDGYVLWNLPFMQRLGISEEDMRSQVERTMGEITRRLRYYRGDVPPSTLRDRVVMLVDDGIATGFTVKAALRSITRQSPCRTVLAVPVAPRETVTDLAGEVDIVVCLATPEPFYGVGQFYREFEQTSDEEVKRLLVRYGKLPAAAITCPTPENEEK
ncbi:hypothetical protein SY88_07730 [Clostridiales bacterium PH28_bin88]|nr:hypothetical protein SY88_07730 [Clostridiales bacterium PH28_bin88]